LTPILLATLVFVCLCGAVAAGMILKTYLPGHHINTDSKEVIRLATAIVGTLSALALGLLIASAKTTYDDANSELRSSAARVVLLDRVMAHYGPETADARNELKKLVEKRLTQGWTAATADAKSTNSEGEFQDIEAVQTALRALQPKTDSQRQIQGRALEVSGVVAEGHWLLVESSDEGLPWAFLAVLVLWLALLFATFGLQAPSNATVVCILVVCALSVAAAIFLIIEMANPYHGLIQISDDPLRAALARLGQS
jgi:hypothetical protein